MNHDAPSISMELQRLLFLKGLFWQILHSFWLFSIQSRRRDGQYLESTIRPSLFIFRGHGRGLSGIYAWIGNVLYPSLSSVKKISEIFCKQVAASPGRAFLAFFPRLKCLDSQKYFFGENFLTFCPLDSPAPGCRLTDCKVLLLCVWGRLRSEPYILGELGLPADAVKSSRLDLFKIK